MRADPDDRDRERECQLWRLFIPGFACNQSCCLTATVEPITTPGNGWLYRLTYQVRESGGIRGATLVNQHFVLSNGTTADGAFSTTPRVAANSTITIQSTLSVLTTTAAASHVAFSITFTDDGGLSGSASAEADIAPKN